MQGAKGNIAFGVGLMVLLMVVTIIYLPLVLPLLLPGVSVNPWDIAKSLIVLMLIPLAIGLLIKSHSPETAAAFQPVMGKISSVSILVLLVVGLGLNISNIIDLIGSGGLVALLLFIVGSLLIGLLLGGRDPQVRSVLGLGTAQRNVSAAIGRERAKFRRDEHAAVRAGGALLLLLILLPTAKRLGAVVQAAPAMGERDPNRSLHHANTTPQERKNPNAKQQLRLFDRSRLGLLADHAADVLDRPPGADECHVQYVYHPMPRLYDPAVHDADVRAALVARGGHPGPRLAVVGHRGGDGPRQYRCLRGGQRDRIPGNYPGSSQPPTQTP